MMNLVKKTPAFQKGIKIAPRGSKKQKKMSSKEEE